MTSTLRAIPRRVRRLPVTIGYYRGPLLMSALRKRWVRLRNPDATIVFGRHTYLGPGFSLHAPHGGTFVAGDRVEFRRNFRAELAGPGARVEIGSGSYCTYDVVIACSTRISIGERCGIGQDCYITDGNHRYRDLDVPFLAQGYDFREITIADDAQVHSKCTIVHNIGTRAIIGANAVITKPIPPYCVAGGVPARVLDYYGPESERPPELATG